MRQRCKFGVRFSVVQRFPDNLRCGICRLTHEMVDEKVKTPEETNTEESSNLFQGMQMNQGVQANAGHGASFPMTFSPSAFDMPPHYLMLQSMIHSQTSMILGLIQNMHNDLLRQMSVMLQEARGEKNRGRKHKRDGNDE